MPFTSLKKLLRSRKEAAPESTANKTVNATIEPSTVATPDGPDLDAMAASPRRLVIQMSGAPGSGKSSTAKSLLEFFGGIVIDHDVIRSSLLEDDDMTFEKAAQHAYRLQWALADQVASQGHTVFIDSPCNWQEIIDRGQALAQKHAMDYWYIECQVNDMDVLDARLRAREGAMRSQRTAMDRPPAAAARDQRAIDPKAQFKKWMKQPCRPTRNVVLVDSTRDPGVRRDFILDQILGAAR